MIRIVASFFSGVEANHVAIQRAGVPWRTDTVSEIEPFPCAVLAERCPDAVNLGDFTKLNPGDMYAAEIAVGGPPCQSFSIAGGRKGLDDDRGNLTLQYVDLCHDLNTNGSLRVAFYENVPGILSDKTNAFGCLISALVGGVDAFRKPRDASWPSYGMAAGPRARLAWRTLDAQWFGLAQRRRRVFIVVSFDPHVDPAEILFERKSLHGDTAPSRETGEGFAADVGDGSEIRDWGGVAPVAPCLKANGSPRGDQKGMETSLIPEITHTMRGEGFDASEDGTGRGTPLTVEARPIAFSAKDYRGDAATELSPTLRAGGHDKTHANSGNWMAVAFNARQDPDVTGDRAGCVNAGSPQDQAIAIQERGVSENPDAGPDGAGFCDDGAAYTLEARHVPQAAAFDLRGREDGAQMEGPHDTANIRAASGGSSKSYISTEYAVRRLMPVETERLQGFPDGWTKIAYRNKPTKNCPDGHRYKAMGNSWAVNVIAWIYLRIEAMMAKADKQNSGNNAE